MPAQVASTASLHKKFAQLRLLRRENDTPFTASDRDGSKLMCVVAFVDARRGNHDAQFAKVCR